VSWTSSDPSVATVSGSGLVTALKSGTATISATSEGQSGSATVSVSPVPVASVTVTPPTASTTVGGTVDLTATVRDAGGNALADRAVAWSSSDQGIATVSSTGTVTGVAPGSATITATSEGRSGSAVVTVTAPQPVVATVTLTPADRTVKPGNAVTLTATCKDSAGNAINGLPIGWSLTSTPDGIATLIVVDGNPSQRRVQSTGNKEGVATVTATCGGQKGSTSVRFER
jgi:uncharacterized protein YjdB